MANDKSAFELAKIFCLVADLIDLLGRGLFQTVFEGIFILKSEFVIILILLFHI